MSTPSTHLLLFLLISCHLFPTGDEYFPYLSMCHLLSGYLSVNTCTHMCPQSLTHTAKPHRIPSRLLSETHAMGGTSLDPQINTENNPNIMSLIIRVEILMNNNSKNEQRLNSVSPILPTAEKQKSTSRHLNFSPQRVRRFCRITGN